MPGRVVADRWSVVILGGARDFHAVDWYRAVQRVLPQHRVVLLTDSLAAEGFPQLVSDFDNVEHLVLIDRLLPKAMWRYGHAYRNAIKLLMAPLQALKLWKLFHRHGKPLVHAHPMYFMLVAKIAGVPYIGTPQGAELMVRPKSFAYRVMARWLLRSASSVVVDSEQMRTAAAQIANIDALVIQNGINVTAIATAKEGAGTKDAVVSIRGMAPLYRIEQVIRARDIQSPEIALTFVYPFNEPEYLALLRAQMSQHDRDLGRLSDKQDLFALMKCARLVVSVPESDSSPRSVYEAIFCGAAVAASANPYIESLPQSMRDRVFVVDLDSSNWLREALAFADRLSGVKFSPCPEALRRYNEDSSIREVASRCYGIPVRE